MRQRAVPAEFQRRVASVYLMGLFGGLVIGAAIGGVVAELWGMTARVWVWFVGLAVLLVVIWQSLDRIAHQHEIDRADPA